MPGKHFTGPSPQRRLVKTGKFPPQPDSYKKTPSFPGKVQLAWSSEARKRLRQEDYKSEPSLDDIGRFWSPVVCKRGTTEEESGFLAPHRAGLGTTQVGPVVHTQPLPGPHTASGQRGPWTFLFCGERGGSGQLLLLSTGSGCAHSKGRVKASPHTQGGPFLMGGARKLENNK